MKHLLVVVATAAFMAAAPAGADLRTTGPDPVAGTWQGTYDCRKVTGAPLTLQIDPQPVAPGQLPRYTARAINVDFPDGYGMRGMFHPQRPPNWLPIAERDNYALGFWSFDPAPNLPLSRIADDPVDPGRAWHQIAFMLAISNDGATLSGTVTVSQGICGSRLQTFALARTD
jgi:hypothetical protein